MTPAHPPGPALLAAWRRCTSRLPFPAIWLLVPAALALGLLLFLVIWLSVREPALPAQVAALPQHASSDGAAALPAPRVDDPDGVIEIDTSAPPPVAEVGHVLPSDPPEAAHADDPTDGLAVGTAGAVPGTAAGAPMTRAPVATRRPAPRYPRAALRRGESGEVMLQVQVGANGRPQQVDVARSSGSQALDRAAVDAVRRWRFDPALDNGQPVAGVVQIPVAFDPAQ